MKPSYCMYVIHQIALNKLAKNTVIVTVIKGWCAAWICLATCVITHRHFTL